MKKTSLMTAMAVVIGGAVMASAAAHAQTKPIEVWQPWQQAEQDPAKRVAPMPQQSSDVVSHPVEPVQVGRASSGSTTPPSQLATATS